MLSGSHTFDDLLSKLIFYKQWLKFQFSRKTLVNQALALLVLVVPTNGGSSCNENNSNGKAKSNAGRRNWNSKACKTREATGTTTTILYRMTHLLGVCLLVLYMLVHMFHRHLLIVLLLWVLTFCLQTLISKPRH